MRESWGPTPSGFQVMLSQWLLAVVLTSRSPNMWPGVCFRRNFWSPDLPMALTVCRTTFAPPPNHPPVVTASANPTKVFAGSGDSVVVQAQASDPDNDTLTYAWSASGGAIEGSGAEVRWNSNGVPEGSYTMTVKVDDGRGGSASASTGVKVEPRPNRPPTINCAANP